MARFHIGLENIEDLIEDLNQGLAALRAHASQPGL
jgi:cystathionine beta-lyase/cystathionine gamma-synthase